MVLSFLSQFFITEKMDPQQQQERDLFVSNLPYHCHISALYTHFPHLESLSLYSQKCEISRVAGKLGSHNSNSILVAEIDKAGNVILHRINCYNKNNLEDHHDMLTGTGDPSEVRSRVLIIEDLSPAAIEILGSSLNLDPHVFYFHLGFDTRRSAMVDLIDPDREKLIPVNWYMPSHGPEKFFNIPLPCDLKPFNLRQLKSGLQMCTTYSQQAYWPIADLLQPQGNWDPPQRAFHRISVIFPQTKIETGKFYSFSAPPVLKLC